MKKKFFGAVVAGCVCCMTFALAEDKKAAMPDEKAMMAQMEKMAAKGEPHKILASWAGDYKVDCSMYMPGAEKPEKSEGMNKNELILDGRWLRSEFKGTMMGHPFTGVGLTGYDNSLQKWVGTWVDSMSTMIVQMQGTSDASGKVITMNSENYCPMHGKAMPFKYVYTMMDGGSYKFEIFGPGPDGKEMKAMEMMYSKK